MSGRQAELARTVMDLIFEPGGAEAFATDPAAFGARRGLEGSDQAALARYARRLGVYRGLVRASLLDPLGDAYPLTQSLLDEAGLWEPLLDAFLASRAVTSLYYRDIPPTFLAWLAETAPHADRYPWLLSLAHYEYMELEILRWPEPELTDPLGEVPTPASRALFHGAFRNLAYGWRVHEADEDAPEPEPGSACLACYRDLDGRFTWRELPAPTSAFLTAALEGQPLGMAAEAAGLPWTEAASLVLELRADGALQGFQG